jgi:hypothetical protein
MVAESVSTAYFINPSHLSVCLYVCSTIGMQRLGKNVTAAKNTHETVEEFLDALFSMHPCRMKRK